MVEEVIDKVWWGNENQTPTSEGFPLTPLEAWYILQGYAVKPKYGSLADSFEVIAGRFEIVNGRLVM